MRDCDIRGWFKKTVPFFILAGVVIFFFHDVASGGKIFVHRDLSRYFYPLREFSRTRILSGNIPLWNPYIHCGNPHLACLQTGVFYPLSVIYLFFSYAYAFNLFILIHVFLSGVFMLVLMRHWKHSREASLFAALTFMLSGYMISVINLPASLASVTWLPLVIVFYDRSLKDDFARGVVFTGLFLTFMFLGGEPSIPYATFFILLLLGFGKKNFIRSLIVSFLIMVGLGAFQILPFVELLFYSSRGAMDFREASMWSLPPYALLDLLIPFLSEADYLYKDYWTRQSWLLVYYMGLLPVVCGFIALKIDVSERRKRIFYLLSGGVVLSFGVYTPIYYFMYRLMPGFAFSRYPIKFFFIIAFSVAILSGIGLDCCRRNILYDKNMQKTVKNILALGFIFSLLYLIFHVKYAEILQGTYDNLLGLFGQFGSKKNELAQFVYVGITNLRRFFGIFMMLGLFLFLPMRGKIKPKYAVLILLGVSFFDLFTANKHVYRNMDTEEFVKPSKTVEFLMRDKSLYRTFNSPSTIRENVFVPEKDYFEGIKSLKERMATNSGVSYGIYDAYGYGSLYGRRHENIINMIVRATMPDELNVLNMLNVKYVISTKDFTAGGYEKVEETEKVNIYENKNVLQRAFLSDAAVVMEEERDILAKLGDKSFDPLKEVIIEESAAVSGQKTDRNGYKKVSIIKYEPEEALIRAQSGSGGFLVLSDRFYPGWKAYRDGRRTKIYRANYILRAVYVPPGEHVVKFIYKPFSFLAGSLITGITLIFAGYLVFGRAKARKAR